MSGRPRRLAQIAALLRQQPVTSQDQLQGLLAECGIRVAQATLSRDLRSLGVLKGPSGYRLPDHAHTASPDADTELHRVLSQYAVAITTAHAMVVVHTGPGHAPVVALELDHCDQPAIVGTIAGDDTIMIATPSTQRAADLARTLGELAGLSTTDDSPARDLGAVP